MNTELAQLTARLDETQARLDRAEREARDARRRARLSGIAALSALALTVLLNVRPAALAQSPGVTLASLLTRIQALEQKTAPMTTTSITTTGSDGQTHSGYLVTFSGANVQIVSGANSSYSGVTNGLGNLIVGYNDGRGSSGPDVRTGSHNLILGDENNYSSYGGLIAGAYNSISRPYASVSGGSSNIASGYLASVSGGVGSTASGSYSSVSGGFLNTASGDYSSVSGGAGNTASGESASVSGGGVYNLSTHLPVGVTVSGEYGWAAGGTGTGTYHSP